MTTFDISVPAPGIARFTTVVATVGTPLSTVRPNDYVNITSNALDPLNNGSFEISKVYTAWNTGAGKYDQYFEVLNHDAVAQSGIDINTADLQFYRPTPATLYTTTSNPVILNQDSYNSWRLTLPATTQAVGRAEDLAAYLQPTRDVSIDSGVLLDDGTLELTTSTPHGLTVGSRVLLSGLVTSSAEPGFAAGNETTTGNPATTDVSQATIWSQLRSDLSARSRHAATLLSTGDVLFAGGYNDNSNTTLSDCIRFGITGSSIITSGVAKNRSQYTYNWIATASLGAVSAQHCLDGLFGTLVGKALITGGRTVAGAGTAQARLYDATANTWTNVANGTLTARYAHQTVRVLDINGDDVVYIIGGNTTNDTTSTGSIQMFTSAGGGTISLLTTESVGRHRHRACAATDSIWVATGGAKSGGSVPRSDCLIYDQASLAFVSCGPMDVARMDHALVALGNGMVMAIGGTGRRLSNETANRTLTECEILDTVTGKWTPAGHLAQANSNPSAFLHDEKVYVVGGSANNYFTEVYDVATGKWGRVPSTADQTIGILPAFAMMSQGLLAHGGVVDSVVDTATLLVFGSNVVSPTGSINRELTVSAIPSNTIFDVSVISGQTGIFGSGSLEDMAALPAEFDGPYIWNPNDGVAMTETVTSLQQTIREGGQYLSLTVASTAAFPDSPGWIVLSFGFDDQVGPIRYFGRISDTQLSIDGSFKFTRAFQPNVQLMLLGQRAPLIPPTPATVGSFYLTDSSAGRVAAQKTIEAATAAGIDFEIDVIFPGDFGLGNAGRPSKGVQKITDAVWIWGGDDMEAETQAARDDNG